MEKEVFDLNEYKDLEQMIGYDGFVSPNGSFYRVRPVTEIADLSTNLLHKTWALAFCREKGWLKLAKEEYDYFDNLDQYKKEEYLQKIAISVLCDRKFAPYCVVWETYSSSSISIISSSLNKSQTKIFNALNNYYEQKLAKGSDEDVQRTK